MKGSKTILEENENENQLNTYSFPEWHKKISELFNKDRVEELDRDRFSSEYSLLIKILA
jgi:hypothetical protein